MLTNNFNSLAFKDDDVEKKHIDAVEEPLLSAHDQEAENSTDHSDQSYSYSTGSMTNSQQVNLRHVVSSEDHLKDVDDYVKHSSSKHTEHEQLLPKLKSSNDNTYTEINPNRVRRISANKLRTFSSDSIQYDPDFGKRTNLAVRIPWGAFFSNPVSLTLFFNHWTYVSSNCHF